MTQPTNLHPEDIRPGVYLMHEGIPFEVDYPHEADTRHFGIQWHVKKKKAESVLLSECSGIPLTDNVVHTAGFTSNLGMQYRCDSEFGLIWINKESGENFFTIKVDRKDLGTCYYLHELQNLYRSLTRTDLTINAAQLAEAVKGANHE